MTDTKPVDTKEKAKIVEKPHEEKKTNATDKAPEEHK